MRSIAILSVCFFLATVGLQAQTVLKTAPDSTAADTSHHKTGIKVSVINPNGKQAMAYSGHVLQSDSVQQALKVNPFNFIRGEYGLYYEYRLSDAFSVEGEAGVTYIDYIYEIFDNGARFISRANERNNVKFYSGFCGRAQFRWYPSRYETAITGYYLAPEVAFRNYKMDYLVNTGLINEPHPIERKWTELKLQIGYQDADPYENVFWEWYFAAGVRHINDDHVNGSGINAEFTHEKGWRPVVGGGIKVGFTL